MPLKVGGKKYYLSKKKREKDIASGKVDEELTGSALRYLNPLGVGFLGYDLLQNPTKVAEHEARKDFEGANAEEDALLQERQLKQNEADYAIDRIFREYPELRSNSRFISELEKSLGESGKSLQDILERTTVEGKKNITGLKSDIQKSREQLAKSETEARTGIDKSLDIYRNLAKRRTLPGQAMIEDQLGESTANALSAIKKSGGGTGLKALTDIYRSEMEGKRNLGIQAAGFQAQNLQNLAGAEANAGTTMADIMARNAVTGANLSNTIYGAQSDYLNKLATSQTNIAQQQANTANTIYGVKAQDRMNQYQSQVDRTNAQLGFQTMKYQMNDPFSAQLQSIGEDKGFAYAGMARAIAQRNENNRMLMNLGVEGLKGVATGGLSLPSSFMNFNSNQTVGNVSGGAGVNSLGFQNYLNQNKYTFE